MKRQQIFGILLVAGGLLLALHALYSLDTWENRLTEWVGYTNRAPYFELVVAAIAGLLGIVLLLKRRTV